LLLSSPGTVVVHELFFSRQFPCLAVSFPRLCRIGLPSANVVVVRLAVLVTQFETGAGAIESIV